jgi:hypothetical protein
MNLIRQQHADGCGAACLAMLLDISYDNARKILPGYTSYESLYRALVDNWRILPPSFSLRLVGDDKRQHWILFYDNKFYDPAYNAPTAKMNKRYARVLRTIG